METRLEDFELKESSIKDAGLGLFSKVDIPENTYLAFKPRNTHLGVKRHVSEIPKEYLHFCIAETDDMYNCPRDFDNIEMLWYLNHSFEPNADKRVDGYYSSKNIAAGDEIVIDYNSLNEPEDKKEAYYQR
ncbi:MAG TPA: SET domain-containing protein [Candidatus Saccharimonadales bacterium]|nr:SET domain-containing protein [Candidatus Saccharimonadales bacterium]